MSNTDEQIQNDLETGRPVNERDPNARTYRILFTSLGCQPGKHLRPGFDERVIGKLQARTSKSSVREIVWFVSGVILLVVCLVVSLSMITISVKPDFLPLLDDFKGIFATGVALIALFQWLDKKLVRREM